MRKLSVKIAIIFFAILITIIAAVSTLAFLINSGKLKHSIERRIKTDTNLDVNIEDIHLGFFSDLQLKHISVKGFSDQEQFTLECNTITIRYKPFDLLKRHIKGVVLSDVQIILDAEKGKTISPPTPDGYEIPSFNIKDFYPEHLLIENFSVNNTKIKITTGEYTLTLNEMDMQVKDIQLEKPLDISIQGNVSISNLQNAHLNLSGEIDINTKYSLPDDELIIQDGSYFLVNDLEKLSINGKVNSIISLPEINCKISMCGLPMKNIQGLLSNLNLMDSPSLILGGEYDLNLSVQGNFNKLKLNSNNLIKSLSFEIEETVFKADVMEIPIEATLSLSDPKLAIEADGEFIVHEGHLQIPNGQITAIDLVTAFTLDYPNQMTLSSNVINGDLHYNNTHYAISKLISNIKSDIDLKLPESIQFQAQIDTMFSDTAHIMGSVDMEENVIRDTTLKIHNINGKSLSEIFKPMIPENYKDWSLNGNIYVNTIIGYAEKDKSHKMTAITDVSLSKLGFSSPDYDYFAEGINGHIKINVNTDSSFREISFDTNGIVEPFLFQLGEFTSDMRNRKTHLSLNGNYDIQNNNLNEVKSVLSWDNLGTLTHMGKYSEHNRQSPL